MIHDVLGMMPAISPRIALVFFFIFFALVLLWTMRGGRGRYDDVSRLPFEDGQSLAESSSESQRTSHE